VLRDGTGGFVTFSLEVGASGRTDLAGVIGGTFDFGGGPLTSAGADDVVLASLAPDGTPVRVFRGPSVHDNNNSNYMSLRPHRPARSMRRSRAPTADRAQCSARNAAVRAGIGVRAAGPPCARRGAPR